MPQMGGYYPNGQPVIQPEGMMPEGMIPDGMMMPDEYSQSRLHQIHTMSSETLNSYSDMDDPNRVALPPQSSSAKTRSSSKSKGSSQEGSGSSGEEYDPENDKLDTIPDEEDEEGFDTAVSSATLPSSASAWSKDEKRKFSDASSASRDHSPIVKSPASDEHSTPYSRPVSRPHIPRQQSRKNLKAKGVTSAKWSHLSKDVRYYLNYHRQNLTFHHYSMKYDVGDFLKTTFLEIALGYEPLLYAITAFSAYHHTLATPNGKIQMFLGYYNKSVSLLRHSLEKSPRHTLATLLTILQLATLEEFLGDWVNLMGHQKAALMIITELFTPQTIMQSETHRKIISWYIRFDLFAGFLSGYETVLDREWHVACTEFYLRQARDRPKDLGSLFEEKFGKSRLVALDVSLLFARKANGTLSDEDFASGLIQLSADMAQMEHELETAFEDSRTYVKHFPKAPKLEPEEDLMNSTDPEFLWADELFTWNFILIDFWAIHLLFKTQVAQVNPSMTVAMEMGQLAFKVCKMFEALQYCDKESTAMILGAQASLGISAACLPKEEKYTMWCRRKYATVEACGYIYPNALRQRMTGIWGVDVTRWWLPNDEGYPPILQSIREFSDYRARIPEDTVATDLRDMKGLFNALSLDTDSADRESRGTGTDSDQFDFGLDGVQLYDSSPDMNWV
ncbi:hypothetical protein MBLNU459_g0152t2 [Dothideomycetes sp. NU459]